MSIRAEQLPGCCGVILIRHFGESPDNNDLYTPETVLKRIRQAYEENRNERAFLMATLNEYEFEAFGSVFSKEGWLEAVRPTLNPRTHRYIYTLFKPLVNSEDRKKKTSIFRGRRSE